MRTIRARLERLESGLRNRPSGKRGVVRCLPGESIEQAAERATREGYEGVLVVPGVMSLEEWEPFAQASQAALIAAHQRLLKGEGSAEEIALQVAPDPVHSPIISSHLF